MKTFLHWSILSGILIVPFIPFVVSSTMLFPFITGKGFLFRILIEIIFALWVYLAFLDSNYRPKMNKISWSLLIFGLIVFVANIFGENPYKSFWSNYERMEGFITIIHIIIYYFVVTFSLNTEKLWSYFWNTVVTSSFIMSIYGVFQLFGYFDINQGGVRVDGRLGNATYLAIYLVFNIFLGLFLLYRNYFKNKLLSFYYILTILLNIIILYYTATRGAILGLIIGVFISSVIIILKEQNKLFRKISIYIIAFMSAIFILFLLFRNTAFIQNSPVLSRFSSISISEVQNQGRRYVWPMALEGFKENPILGWGQENFNYVFNKFYNPLMYNQEQWFDRTHNVILDWLIASGILGLIAYLSIYLFTIIYLFKKTNFALIEKSIFFGLLSAYFFHNLFVFDNLISYIMFMSVLAFINTESVKNVQNSTKKYNPDLVNYGIAPAVIIITVLVVYFVNVPAIMQSKYLIKSISIDLKNKPDPTKNIEYMKKAFSYNSFGHAETVEQVVPLSVRISQIDYSNDIKKDIFNVAYEETKKQVEKTPNDIRYLLLFGSLLNRFGIYDQASTSLEKAISISPKKPVLYLELGSMYLSKGDLNKAMEVFKLAYDIEPRFKESAILYATASIYSGKQDILSNVLSKIDEQTFLTDDRFLKAFVDTKNYNVALSILNKRLEIYKENQDYYMQTLLSLAALNSQIGNKNKAIEILKQMILIDPKFKEQGEFYIKDLSK